MKNLFFFESINARFLLPLPDFHLDRNFILVSLVKNQGLAMLSFVQDG